MQPTAQAVGGWTDEVPSPGGAKETLRALPRVGTIHGWKDSCLDAVMWGRLRPPRRIEAPTVERFRHRKAAERRKNAAHGASRGWVDG